MVYGAWSGAVSILSDGLHSLTDSASNIVALVVAGFSGHAGFRIAQSTSNILTDRVVMNGEDLRRVVLGVPEVLGCHEIRTRGSADHVFLDLHVWFKPDMRLDEAHRLSHVVKD